MTTGKTASTLTSGTRIGPYEIVSILGQGGMGEVYRARDERLAREVAIKVLPARFAAHRERLQRFEQEARAAGQLNHPNILAIYDVGSHEGTPFIVSELLEGRNLREILDGGRVGTRRAVELAIQVAHGLSAAHAKGIVHRDLKPENLIVLPDGRLKILDFGIAKLTREVDGRTDDTGPTLAALTVEGEILGTASYMAPEQIRDHPTDHRADLFTLAAILYEMLSGEKAFSGETPADRMSAILRADPPALPKSVTEEVPGLDDVLRRCLRKEPDGRLDSARDLAFALELLLRLPVGPATGAKSQSLPPGFKLRRITFQDGTIWGASFGPDGHTIAYAAEWGGDPSDIFVTRIESPESRPMGMHGAQLLSVSPTSELAVVLDVVDAGGFIRLGTLARVPMLGGVPRRIAEHVFHADWGPGGKTLAVIRQVEERIQLEYPIGNVIHRARGWISHVQVSPDGKRLAVLEHPTRGSNAGNVLEMTLDGRSSALVEGMETVWGLVWHPSGREVMFSAHGEGVAPGIYAASQDGVRFLYHPPGYMHLFDMAASGEALVVHSNIRMRLEWRAENESRSRELSWLDWSLARGISPDGQWVLFDETGVSETGESVYIRSIDGAPAVRLGGGTAIAFSPDGQWVLGADTGRPNRIVLHPTGVGESRSYSTGAIRWHSGAWFPDGRSVCLSGGEPGRGNRLYRLDLDSGNVDPITGEGFGRILCAVSPDGTHVIASDPAGSFSMCSVDGGEAKAIAGLEKEERPIGWAPEGSAILAFKRGGIPCKVLRIDLESGRREPWLELTPKHTGGITGVNSVCFAPDGRSCAFSYMQVLDTLYLARGLA